MILKATKCHQPFLTAFKTTISCSIYVYHLLIKRNNHCHLLPTSSTWSLKIVHATIDNRLSIDESRAQTPLQPNLRILVLILLTA
uniref:Uncharacterized protein n=1 Tax=Lactuca sativa TaxID=4236 RepID=A0A9R1WQ68_LACSA|nr:hypothetical protein LSAT_V11C900500740 [Lactuca sativa]